MTYYISKDDYLSLLEKAIGAMNSEWEHDWHPEDIASQVEFANDVVRVVLENLPAKEVTD